MAAALSSSALLSSSLAPPVSLVVSDQEFPDTVEDIVACTAATHPVAFDAQIPPIMGLPVYAGNGAIACLTPGPNLVFLQSAHKLHFWDLVQEYELYLLG
ncbi:uncharacterized protein BJ212DRAFT_1477676 [Suillus subaureus]|uniref:Uncharacterized protein n=1 Tax=Suillus subaureus TaxID=48587 RepID=A0A9P7EH77_9AGAM|nr:uncharacterized protein BJ212DRAFT_1477676 [Suillus subaureus]KAG1821839.1 hypothetical protein BJ212DRAFT_1477676 [Suillus subaureus]